MKKIVFILSLVLHCNVFGQESLVEGKPENLGPSVNTSCYDYRPRVSPDGSTLYFTRILCSNGDENYLFYSTKDKSGEWTKAKRLEAKFNNGKNSVFIYSVSPDNNQLLLTIIKDGRRRLFTVKRTGMGWAEPEEVELGVKLPETDATFCMNNEGNALLFTYNGENSLSGRDLYVSFLKDGKWTYPKHTGTTLNNKSYILSPFLAADGVTLYFAGIREGGFGSWDIYVSKRLDDSWTKWTEPVNMGPEINDSGHNESFFLDALGEYAYFNGNKNSFGGNDIYRIKLKEKAKPNPVVLVEGLVTNNKNGDLLGATIIYENLDNGKEAGRAFSIQGDGKYKITLPAGKKYAIIAEVKGFYSINENLDLTSVTEFRTVKKDIKLIPIEVGETIRLNNIFFERGKFTIKPESMPELNRLVKLLKDNPDMVIEIGGHTNNIGPDEANRILSENRANEVKKYLISQRIEEKRIKTVGYGETKPIGDNSTEEGRIKNQRVEFTISKK